MKIRRTLQERLALKPALIGFLQIHPNPSFAELAGACGYDFLLLDDEHGVFTASDHLQTLQTVGGSEMAVFVRLSGHDTQAMGRFMDMGADGIVVPNVSTADQARALAQAMVYPPRGTRGFGAAAHRETSYGMNLAAHLKDPRACVSLLLIIESALGVAGIEEILAVDGVDGVIIGPSDLSANLGCAGDYSNQIYTEAIARIERAATAQGKVFGTAPHAGSPVDALLRRGHRLLIMGSDVSVMREGMTAQIAKVTSCF